MKSTKLITILATLALAAATGCSSQRQLYYDDGGTAVDIGYGKAAKRSLTTSVAGLKVKDNEIATYNNIYDYIKGRVPGVMVIGNAIYIRGINSINGSSEALLIVDGMQVSDISYLNPRDVDNISIIKDGAAAIYGTRGGNGVVLINTKKAPSKSD